MAVPSYTTDLTDFEDFETANVISTELTGYTDTSKGEDQEADFPIQGTQHASAEQRTAAKGSLASDFGSNITWTSGDNFFMWGIFLAPNAVNTDANAGIEMCVGSAITDFHRWTVGGRDFGRYPYGGWQNFVVNPEISTGRTTTGNPGTNYRWVGMLCDVTSAIAKGSPYGIDVIRYGRGELIVTDGQVGNYATFAGMATENDSTNNKWGLFQEQAGTYLWKGLMSLGTTTAVDFRDSNRVIIVDNTRRVLSSFNRIEINNTSSNIEWSNISIDAEGTVAKGELEVIDNATVLFDTCIFTDMSTFIFNGGTNDNDVIDCTFRRCGQITQSGATLNGCLIDQSTASSAILADNLSAITNCNFIGDSTGHAIELNTLGTGTMSWNNDFDTTTYATTNGSTGNEVLYVNVGTGSLTINVAGGTTPTIRTAGATVNVTASVPITITVKDSDNVAITTANVRIEELDGTQVAQGGVNGSGIYSTTYGGSTPLNVRIKVRSSSSGETRYVPIRTNGTIESSTGLVSTLTMTDDSIVAT